MASKTVECQPYMLQRNSRRDRLDRQTDRYSTKQYMKEQPTSYILVTARSLPALEAMCVEIGRGAGRMGLVINPRQEQIYEIFSVSTPNISEDRQIVYKKMDTDNCQLSQVYIKLQHNKRGAAIATGVWQCAAHSALISRKKIAIYVRYSTCGYNCHSTSSASP